MRCLVLLSLCVSGSALAAPPPGAKANPPRFIDEASLMMKVGNASPGYWVQLKADIHGYQGNDRVRLDVKRGGKVVSKIPCKIGDSRIHGVYQVVCDAQHMKGGKPLTGAGPLDADLVYEDDANDKEYLLRTLKVNVKQWEKDEWQIEGDDLLGVAHLVARPAQSGWYASLRFWVANTNPGEAVLKCSVDGKPLPEIEGHAHEHEAFGAVVMKPTRTSWNWTLVDFSGDRWYYAPDERTSKDNVYLSAHPGTWECKLRKNGVTLREFKWKVLDDKGRLESHAMQQAPDAALLPRDHALVEMRIPAGNGLDKRIKPDAIKKSRGFGMPWPKHESVKALLAALPPAYENANPVAAQKKAKGKLIIGSEANPPRFVDESSALVRLVREMNGYGFHVNQWVGGVNQSRSNTYRVDWKQGAKILATAKCQWNASEDKSSPYAWVECNYREKPLTAKGAIEAQLVMYDDNDGNEYLLRSYKFTVAKYPSFGDPVWQLVPDDVLATAWVQHRKGVTSFRFWLAMDDARPELRCTVEGTKLPDIRLSQQTSDPSIEASTYNKAGTDKKHYIWQWIGGDADITPGPLPKDAKKDDRFVSYLAHYPGKWDCQVRQEGKVLRKLLFTVSEQGYVQADPAQAGPATMPNVVPIELQFGKDMQDVRVRPDAMKKSRGFGLPWPKPPTKQFPKASGLPDPK